MKKQLLIGIGIFLAVILAVFVVYTVQKPSTALPTPKPAAPLESPVAAPVLEVQPGAACTTSFVVACASGTPTPSPSASVSPSPSAPSSGSLSCVVKRMYEDDSRNRAGLYYTEQEINDTNTIENNQVIVYNVVARNTGGTSVPSMTITDVLSGNLTYLDGDSGCSYDSANRRVTCIVGDMNPGAEVQRNFRVRVNVSGTTSVANTAEVSSTNGQRDSCSIEIDATGKVSAPPSSAPSELPEAGVFEVTTGTLGIGLIFLLIGGLGLLLISN